MKHIVSILVFMLCLGIAHADNANYKAAYQSGEKSYMASQYADARKAFESALALATKPSETAATEFYLGTISNVEGKYGDARAELSKVLVIQDADASIKRAAQLGIGLSYLNGGEPYEAQKYFSTMLTDKSLPIDMKPVLLHDIGLSYMAENDFMHAREIFNLLLKSGTVVPPLDSIIHIDIANSYVEEKNYDQARKEYEELLKPDSLSLFKPMAQLQIAKTYILEKKYDLAEEAYRKVLEMKGTDAATTGNKLKAENQLKLLSQLSELEKQMDKG